MKKQTFKEFFGGIPGWCKGLSLGCLCLALGAYYDQFNDIFRKAVMICLECIGIG